MDIRSQVRSGLLQRGLPSHVADAFVMNFEDESGLNPGINEIAPLVPGSRGGFGLYQLTGPRRREYEAFAQRRGAPVADVDAQLDFLMTELQGSESRAAKNIFAAKDAGSAAAAIVNDFLRPSPEHRQRRTAKYLSGGGGASTLAGGLSISPQAPQDRLQPTLPQMEAPQMQPEAATGLFGKLFPNATKERQDNVAMALSGLSMNPNQAMMQSIQGRQQDRRDQRKQGQAQQQAAQQANKTAAWLATQPKGQRYAEAVASGALPAGQALQMWQAESKGPTKTALVQQYEMAKGQGYEGTFMDYQTQLKQAGAAQNNVTVNGDPAPEIGTIPQGFEVYTDPGTNERRMRPIPGGPADTEQTEERKQTNKDTATSVINTAAQRARDAYNERSLTGLAGQAAGAINPANQNAELYRQVEVLKSNAKIENLNAMRAASPTGGALGSVTEKESAMLAAAAGALDPASPTFLRDLDDYERTLMRVINGESAPEAANDWQDVNGVKIRVKR